MIAIDFSSQTNMSLIKISAYATAIPGLSIWNTKTWHYFFRSHWHWLLLFIVCAAVTTILRYRRQQEYPDDDLWDPSSLEIKSSKDSPFFAYLGHNILTEGLANDPNNTSVHAIDRIPEHVLVRNALLSNVSEEPSNYDDRDLCTGIPPLRYERSYTYPDTKNQQIRHDCIEHINDAMYDRHWQRRTMHARGI